MNRFFLAFLGRGRDLKDHIDMYMALEEFIEQAYVVQHRGRTYDKDSQSAMNRRTPSPERRATAEDPPSAPNEDFDEVTLGAYGNKALKTRSGVVAQYGYYIIIDGGDSYCQQSDDRYEAAQAFQEWYGFYGAEHHMRADSIARSFPWIIKS